MAIIPNNKGVVTGTKGKNKITWVKKNPWTKNLTVNAGAGNDTITFNNSTYKNKLNGGDGQDIIKGGKKNDTITGGKDSDTIYTGKGTNTVVINKGDGNDAIYNQGTKLTIQMGTPNTKDKTSWQKKGNDLIMTYAHLKTKSDKKQVKEVVTIKNYFKNDGTIANNNIYLKNKSTKKISALFETQGLAIVPAGKTYKGSYLNDKINGSAGNDTIYGFDANDIINGGAGNDVINAGKGNNKIYYGHAQKDGIDTIVNGGGHDTLIFSDIADFEYLNGFASGDNVVLKFEYGENNCVVLQDYLKGGHSLEWVQIGNKKVRTEEIRNKISSSYTATTINGTRWGDEINVYSCMDPVVNSGEGNDIINILTSWNVDITAGKGDDIIDVSGYNTYNLDINLENNCGNDSLRGLMPNISSDSHIGFYGANIVSQAQDGNNLILTMEGGNTFTIENYYTLSDSDKNRLFDEEIGNLTLMQLTKSRSLVNAVYEQPSLRSEVAAWQNTNSSSDNVAYITENTDNYNICQIYSS